MPMTLEPANLLIIHTVDPGGKHGTSEYWIAASETDPSAGGAAIIAAALQDVCANAVTSVEIRRAANQTDDVSPGDTPYARPADKIKMNLQGSDGSLVVIEIGTPLPEILLPDKIHINPAQSDVDAFIVEAKTHMKTVDGVKVQFFKSGYRRRPSRRKQQ